jgi:hypothetical protein
LPSRIGATNLGIFSPTWGSQGLDTNGAASCMFLPPSERTDCQGKVGVPPAKGRGGGRASGIKLYLGSSLELGALVVASFCWWWGFCFFSLLGVELRALRWLSK